MITIRRAQEEIMLKLLINQIDESDIKLLFNLSDKDYFTQYIKPFCLTNYTKILDTIKDTSIRDKFRSQIVPNTDIELENVIGQYNKQNSFDCLPNDYIIKYTDILENELVSVLYDNSISAMNIRGKGLILIMNILIEGDQSNEKEIIKFINRFYIKINSKAKNKFCEMIIDLIRMGNFEKLQRIFSLLYDENERHGTLGITINTIPSNRIKVYNITINHCHSNSQEQYASSIHRLSSNTTLCELLILIIIELNINIDLYSINYQIKHQQKQSLTFTHLDYLKSLGELFLISQMNNIHIQSEVDIQLYIQSQSQINEYQYEQLYYYSINDLQSTIQLVLKDLFHDQCLLKVDDLFSYINNYKLKQAKDKVFDNLLYINYDVLIKSFRYHNNKNDCYLLLHLLIGFEHKDTSKPYLRNIFPKDNIRLTINQLICSWIPLKQYHPNKSKETKFTVTRLFTENYQIELIDHLTEIIQKNNQNELPLNPIEVKRNSFYFITYSNEKNSTYNQKFKEILNDYCRKDNCFYFKELIALIQNVRMDLLLLYDYPKMINILMLNIFHYEFQTNYNSQLFMLELLKLTYAYVMQETHESPFNELILFFYDLIKHFIINSSKWSDIFQSIQFNFLLLSLFSIPIVHEEDYTKKAGIVMCLFTCQSRKTSNVMPIGVDNIIIVRQIKQCFLTQTERYKQLRCFLSHLLELSLYFFDFSSTDMLYESNHKQNTNWIFTAILLQLVNSHQYMCYSNDNDLLIFGDYSLYKYITNENNSSELLIVVYNSLYSTSQIENTYCDYNFIHTILSTIQSTRHVYLFNNHPYFNQMSQQYDLIVSETLIKSSQYNLIGCIRISKQHHSIESYCFNLDDHIHEIKQYTQFAGVIVLAPSKQLPLYESMNQRNDYGFFYFYIRIGVLNKQLSLNEMYLGLKSGLYPSAFLLMLLLIDNTNDNKIKELIDIYKNKVENNQYNIQMLNKIKDKHPKIPKESLDNLIQN